MSCCDLQQSTQMIIDSLKIRIDGYNSSSGGNQLTMPIKKTVKIAQRGIARIIAKMPMTLVFGFSAEASPVKNAAKPAATAAKK